RLRSANLQSPSGGQPDGRSGVGRGATPGSVALEALRGHAPAQRLAADEGLHPLIAREPAAPDDVEVELLRPDDADVALAVDQAHGGPVHQAYPHDAWGKSPGLELDHVRVVASPGAS